MEAALAPTAPLQNNDFADWLSPILVKELRQGLKSRAFVVTFIILQAVMILLVGLELLAFAGGGGREAIGGFEFFFWMFVWLPLLVMMPARGLTAVSDEVRANTLDLVQLTRLTAFRIVLGKWVALISQSLLLVAAVLPYAVLRYFFGQVDVVGDLKIIAALVLASVCLTACAIALSSVHLAVRIIMLVVLLMFLVGLASVSSPSGYSDWSWVLPILAAVYTFLMLEIAAARIAPASENHSAPKRLLCLGLGAAAVLITVWGDAEAAQFWIMASMLPCAWVVLESLCERTAMIPSLYAPFARRGFVGRLAGYALYPGWASGLVFCCLLTALLMGVYWAGGLVHPSWWDSSPVGVSLGTPVFFASIISPVAVLLQFPRVKFPIWLYVLVQAVALLLYMIASIVESNLPPPQAGDAIRWLAVFPTSILIALWNDAIPEASLKFFIAVTIPCCALIAGYLGVRAVLEFRIIARMERESLVKAPLS